MSSQPKSFKPSDIDADKEWDVYDLGSDFYYLVAPAGAVMGDHTHEKAETIWVLSGRGKFQVGDETFELTPMTEIYVASNVYHKLTVQEDMTFIEQRIESS